jgi:hypothetical protein
MDADEKIRLDPCNAPGCGQPCERCSRNVVDLYDSRSYQRTRRIDPRKATQRHVPRPDHTTTVSGSTMQPRRRREITGPLAFPAERSDETAGSTVEQMQRGIVNAIAYEQPIAAGSKLRRSADRRCSAQNLATQQFNIELRMVKLT